MVKNTNMRVGKYAWIVALSFFTSCVDSKYNLGDLNTDDITVGNEWSIPLGTGVIKVDEVIDLEQVVELKTTPEGNYYMRFEDFVDVPKLVPGLRSSLIPAGGIALPVVRFRIDGLHEMFPDNFVLGLENPSLTIKGNVIGSGLIDGSLKLTGSEGIYESPAGSVFTTTSAFALESPSYSVTIKKDLDKLIEGTPQQVDVAATILSVGAGITDITRFDYTLDLPFIPSEKFRAKSTETIKNAFDESLVDYLFSSGTTTIYGTFDNELPFNIDVKMYITDAEGKRLDIDLPTQKVIGVGPQEVSFAFQPKDMPKMKTACNIELEFALFGRPSDITSSVKDHYLNKNQKVTMVLKLKTTGGIKL
ncbi:DUF4621 domain-containing protein [Bacteroides neonati]|uniref:DUF4621 domain-containing protein n=1 Tax=Bacteroides neonati TaxID=1347393 RepID=UPI0004B580B5|nr:DUF4621 domain-containing protein [Bacteroides neonati]